jgi:hypothetical protein
MTFSFRSGVSALPQVTPVQVPREQNERDVDRGQVVGQPAGEVDVGDRAVFGADTLGRLV